MRFPPSHLHTCTAKAEEDPSWFAPHSSLSHEQYKVKFGLAESDVDVDENHRCVCK
jgi:hypothetical protein